MSGSAPRVLPALSESRWLRFGVFTTFYLVQGFPIGLIQIAFPAWLTARGLDKVAISQFVAITTLPWGFKLVAGPFMDRLAFPAMGLRRPWVMAAQTMLVLAACALFFVHDPVAQLGWLTAVCTLMNSCAAVQDVAVDGMAVTLFKDDERGRANGFMVAGQVAGYSLTGWVSVILLNRLGIPGAGLLAVLLVGTVGALAFIFRERPGERILPWTRGAPHPDAPKPVRETWTLMREVLRRVLMPMSLVLLGVELTYRALEGVALVWWPDVAIRQLDYSDEQFSRWNGTSGPVAAVVGLAIGAIIDRVGPRVGIALGLLSNITVYLVVWLTASSLSVPSYAITMLFAASIGSQWMFIATVSTFMKLCGVRVAATQFAVYMGLSNLARSVGSRFFPQIDDWFGPDHTYLFMVFGYAVALGFLLFFSLQRHQDRLDRTGDK